MELRLARELFDALAFAVAHYVDEEQGFARARFIKHARPADRAVRRAVAEAGTQILRQVGEDLRTARLVLEADVGWEAIARVDAGHVGEAQRPRGDGIVESSGRGQRVLLPLGFTVSKATCAEAQLRMPGRPRF